MTWLLINRQPYSTGLVQYHLRYRQKNYRDMLSADGIFFAMIAAERGRRVYHDTLANLILSLV